MKRKNKHDNIHKNTKKHRDSEARCFIYKELICMLFCCKDREQFKEDIVNNYDIWYDPPIWERYYI